MKITRESLMTGIIRTKDIPVTETQLNAWKDGTPIQNAMPNLSMAEREFIISGMVAEEWDDWLMEPDDEEYEQELDNIFLEETSI